MIPVAVGLILLAAGPVVRLPGLALNDPYLYPRIMFSIGMLHNAYAYTPLTAFAGCTGMIIMIFVITLTGKRFRNT